MRIDRRTPIDELPQFLRVDELRDYLAIGRALAYTLARQYGRKVGRHVRIPREAIRAITERQET